MRQSAAGCVAIALSLPFLPALVPGAPPSARGGDDKAPAKADPPLYPLKKGLKWEWSGTENRDSVKWVDEISGTRKINGTECYELRRTISRKKADSVWRQDIGVSRRYLAVSEDGYFEVGFALPGDEEDQYSYYSSPLCLVKPLLKDHETGSSWNWLPKETYDHKIRQNFTHNVWGSNLTPIRETVTAGGKEYAAVRVIQNLSPNRLSETWYVPGRGPVKEERKINVERVYKPYQKMEVVSFQDTNFDIGTISLNADTVEKEVSVESVETDPGAMTKFKRSRTITREASYTTTIGVGAEVEGKLAISLGVVKGELATKVKGTIEKAIGEKLTDSETREVEVTIDGDKLPKAKIIWIDVYRTGTVEVTQDGKNYKIPFEFPIGTKLIIRKAEAK